MTPPIDLSTSRSTERFDPKEPNGAGRPLHEDVLQSAREAVTTESGLSPRPTEIASAADTSGTVAIRLRRYVAKEPVQAALLAALAGAMAMAGLSLLLGRRREGPKARSRQR
jgi:hypothetical protein